MESQKGNKRNIPSDDLLKKSCFLYNQGKFRECLQTLRKVHFEIFDTKEWNLENNLLLCEDKITHAPNLNNVADKFEKLNEKVTGIPPSPQTLLQETTIAINFCCILLSGRVTHKVVDGCFIAGSALTNCVLRASRALDVATNDDWLSSKVISAQETFNNDTLTAVIQLIEKLLQSTKNADVFVTFILSCFILAVLWMARHEVDAGLNLLNIMGDSLSDMEISSSLSHQETILIDTSFIKQVFPLCLLPLPRELGIKPIKAAVTFLSSLCYKYYKHDIAKALGILDATGGTECSYISSCVNYLKGLIYFENNDTDKALQYLNLSVTDVPLVDERYKAACLCMLGCCLSRKGKHHTAIAKFKESLTYDFSHLDSLFYIAQEYQALGQEEAEIQCLKYLCEALVLRCNQETNPQSLLQGHFIPFVDKINGREVNLRYATYWLGKRCLALDRFQEAADALLEVLKEARRPCQPQVASPYALPSVLHLYRDCAFALLKSGREKDCVTMCDNAMEEAQDGEYEIDLLNRDDIPSKKRIRNTNQSSQQTRKFRSCCLEILLCKAAALSQMTQSLQSLECLQRVFVALESCISSLGDEEDSNGKRELKRRKLESDYSRGVITADTQTTKCYKNKELELERKKLLQIKSQAHLIRASVMLQLLDQEKEGLEELHQSSLCDPDNTVALFKYCTLLMKLGSRNVAASDWMKFRGLDLRTKKPFLDFQNRSNGGTDALSFYDVTQKELKSMDDLCLKYS